MSETISGENEGCGMVYGIVRDGRAEYVTCTSVLECQRRILKERGVDIYEENGLGCARDMNRDILRGLRS